MAFSNIRLNTNRSKRIKNPNYIFLSASVIGAHSVEAYLLANETERFLNKFIIISGNRPRKGIL